MKKDGFEKYRQKSLIKLLLGYFAKIEYKKAC